MRVIKIMKTWMHLGHSAYICWHRRIHPPYMLQILNAMFSFLRQLTMWCHAAINRYLLPDWPTAAKLPQRWVVAKWWDRWTPNHYKSVTTREMTKRKRTSKPDTGRSWSACFDWPATIFFGRPRGRPVPARAGAPAFGFTAGLLELPTIDWSS